MTRTCLLQSGDIYASMMRADVPQPLSDGGCDLQDGLQVATGLQEGCPVALQHSRFVGDGQVIAFQVSAFISEKALPVDG